MTVEAILAEVLQLSPDERLQLVDEVWKSICEGSDSVQITDQQRLILEERIEAHRQNPDDVFTWEEVEARLLARLRR